MKLHDLNIRNTHVECDLLEYELQSLIIKNWDCIFPDYLFITKEFPLPGDVRRVNKSGRIDILAMNKISKRFTIIELKSEFDVNIRSQAFDYLDYFLDNKHELYLKVSKIVNLDAILDFDMENVEIILVAKRFKNSDLNLSKTDNNLFLTLISYAYFSNNCLLFSIAEKKAKDDLKTFMNFVNIDIDIDNFWNIFNSMIRKNLIRPDEHFKLIKFSDEYSIYINIPILYDNYVRLCREQNTSYLNLNNLREALKKEDYCKGHIKSTRIGGKNTSAFIFDMRLMKDKIQLN